MASCVFPYSSFFLALGLVFNSAAKISVSDQGMSNKPAHLLRVEAQEVDTTASLWNKAKAAMDQNNFAEARRLLRQAVRQDPKDGALWFHLGVSCIKIDEIDGAISAFERSRALAPKQADVYFDLGLAYWRKGEVNKAKEAYRTGLALRPNESSALQNYTLLLMKTGDYNSATAPLLALKKDPKLGISARAALMECYVKTGQQAALEKETDEIIRDHVAGPAEQSKIAAILLENESPGPAEKLLTNSLSIDPNQANANGALGEIYLKQKKLQDAADCFQRAIQLNPDSSEYAFGLVRALLALQRPSQLVAFLKSVEGKFGELPNYQYALGLAYYNQHHYEDSARVMEKLLVSAPPREDKVEHVLGDSYLSMGELDKAEAAYRKAIDENPKDPEYYVAYATALRRSGPDRLDDAILRLKTAQGMNPSDWRLQLELGLCYESKSQFADAAALIEQAAQSQPDLTAAHVALARIYFRLGRKADSEREKSKATELERKQQEKLVREYSTDSLIDGSSQRDSSQPAQIR